MPIPFADLTARTVLITGGSSGIGRACAEAAARLGARVLLVARNLERLEKVRQSLAGEGHSSTVFDLSDVERIPSMIEGLVGTHGPIHGLVHCAGSHLLAPLRSLKTRDIAGLFSLNAYAAMALAKAFRKPQVHARPGASLVFLSSVVGLVGQPGVAAYASSKGALISLTKSLALELVPDEIRVNCIAAGLVETEMGAGILSQLTSDGVARVKAQHPLGFGRPEDVAHAVVFLLSDAARWITGTTLVVDGGYTAH